MRTLLVISLIALPYLMRGQYDTLLLPFRQLTIEDGLSQGMVNDITQDQFGFMWFATKDGLNRYDGYDLKVYRHDASDPHSLSENYITVVHADRNGLLWTGTASKGVDGFNRRTNTFHHVDLGETGNSALVHQILMDHHDCLWIATNRGLFKVSSKNAAEGILRNETTVNHHFNKPCRITMDGKGRIWGYLASSFSFLITPDNEGHDRIDTLDMARLKEGPWTDDINTNVNGHFAIDPVGGRVFAIHPHFIAEYDTSSLVPKICYQVPYPNGSRLEGDRSFIDQKGVIWMGSNLLFRFDIHSGKLTRVLPRDPNLSKMLLHTGTTFRDQNNLIWIGTTGYGILRYDPSIERFNSVMDGSAYWMYPVSDHQLVSIKPDLFLRVFDTQLKKYIIDIPDNLPAVRNQFKGLMPETLAALRDQDGIYWMCKGNLISYDAARNKVTEFPLTDDSGELVKRRKGYFPLYPDGEQFLWFGADSALCRFDKQSRSFKSYRYPITPIHNPYLFAQAIHRSANGIIWVASTQGLLRLNPSTGEWTHFKNDPNDSESLSFNLLFSLLPDPNEPERYLWIGTNGGGLNRFDISTGKCKRYSRKEGLPNEVVYGVVNDDSGNLWMSTNMGISRFDPATETFTNFDSNDGLQSDEFNRNAFARLNDGSLFFGGIEGFNYFWPGKLKDHAKNTAVFITDIKLINKSIDHTAEDSPLQVPSYMSKEMCIPYSANMITFRFANKDYTNPAKNEFQYQLTGFDQDPIFSGTNNSATYTNLDPGSYVFKVRSKSNSGIWSAEWTEIKLTVLPPWYASNWFYGLVLVAVIAGFITYFRMQKWRREQLEKTVSVRTKQLRREKERSDGLLRNILPVNVADELRTRGHTEAKLFEGVSILFSDFKGFTEASEKLSPQALVEELNICFMAFDRIMEKHGIEKIKTIGDAYMAAGGVPNPLSGGPLSVVRAGLEMQEIMRELKAERIAQNRPFFEMRLGIHTGNVVAGIVGLKKFQYDIWGDTVNVASRMESNGEVGRVNISESTYQLIQRMPESERTGLRFIPRGKIQVKGKGELNMYFVESESDNDTAEKNTRDLLGTKAVYAAGAMNVVPATGVTLEGMRILLVEDNEFNVMVAMDELEASIPGVVIDHAENGKVAVEKVASGNYDFVLMDIQMPEMNGYEATQAIRSMPGKTGSIPIIAMTANVMRAEVDRCTEAGMNGFIPKPFKREELLASLHSVLAAAKETG